MTAQITASTTRTIARNARLALGRAARTGRMLDSAAMDAVSAAARAAGLDGLLWQWATPGASITGLAEAYVGRYVQAYGLGVLA